MLEFAACFALVGLTIAAIGLTIFSLLARHGLIRNAEDEVKRVEAQLTREREAGAREAALKIRVEDLEGNDVRLAQAVEKLGQKIEPYRAPENRDPEVHDSMVGGGM